MDDTSLYFSDYKNIPTAFVGIDLNKKPGVYKIKTTLKDGRFEENTITIIERKKYEEAMPIPVAIGGNSIINQTRVVNTLAQENEILNTLKTSTTSLWIKNFSYPVTNPIITDTYGYARNTGGYAIAHKGTDFRAKVGTPILAMNDGIVRVSKDFTVYGGTIVIDHGQGIMTLYMHLSKRDVSTGDKVISGQTIGLSGGTGYAEGPHLHLSIKINNISIDPMKFIELFEKS
jgi:murein DD-endopeptidase MepM/ murein hydrolase activator NlpD